MSKDESNMSDEADERDEITWEEVPMLQDELRDMAERLLRRWPGMQSLQPTLLMNTALRRQRLSSQAWEEVTWENRAHFFGQAFRAMRQKLIEKRREQQGKQYRASRMLSVKDLEDLQAARAWPNDSDLTLAVDIALEQLETQEPELRLVVEYRFFARLTWDETAEMMELSVAKVRRYWDRARILIEDAMRTALRGSDIVLPDTGRKPAR